MADRRQAVGPVGARVLRVVRTRGFRDVMGPGGLGGCRGRAAEELVGPLPKGPRTVRCRSGPAFGLREGEGEVQAGLHADGQTGHRTATPLVGPDGPADGPDGRGAGEEDPPGQPSPTSARVRGRRAPRRRRRTPRPAAHAETLRPTWRPILTPGARAPTPGTPPGRATVRPKPSERRAVPRPPAGPPVRHGPGRPSTGPSRPGNHSARPPPRKGDRRVG